MYELSCAPRMSVLNLVIRTPVYVVTVYWSFRESLLARVCRFNMWSPWSKVASLRLGLEVLRTLHPQPY